MGRSGSNPHLTRSQNKQRKEAQKFQRVKKYRRQKLGEAKSKEHNHQQEVVGHNKAILKAKVLEVKRRKLAEKTAEQRALERVGLLEEKEREGLKRPREEMESESEVEEDSIDDEAEDTTHSKTVPLDVSDDDGDDAGAADDAEDSDEGEDDEDDEDAAEDAKPKAVRIKITGECYIVSSPAVVVREGEDLESALVGRLDKDTVVDMVERSGRRGRIAAPLAGWVSVDAKDGAIICSPHVMDDEDFSDEDEDEDAGDDADMDADGDDDSIDTDDIDMDGPKAKPKAKGKPAPKPKAKARGGRRGGGQERDRAAMRREKKRERETAKRQRRGH